MFLCPPCIFVSLTALLRTSFSPQLIQSPVTTPLGLIMLKTTSEELACPREDLSVARKEELRKLLLDQVQTVLGLLTGEHCGAGKGCRCGEPFQAHFEQPFQLDQDRTENQQECGLYCVQWAQCPTLSEVPCESACHQLPLLSIWIGPSCDCDE